MRIVLSIVTVVTGAVAVLLVGGLLYLIVTDGFSNGEGMAILFFQLFGGIAAALSLVSGLLGISITRRPQETSDLQTGNKRYQAHASIAKAGVGIGTICLLTLAAMMIF